MFLTDPPCVFTIRARRVFLMSFMQPRVFIANVYEVETEVGTELVLEDVAGKGATAEGLSQYLEGDRIESIELKENAVLGHLTAPGYMDQTELEVFETELEAWESLVENHPEVFRWGVEHAAENPTAHIYAPTEEAAMALQAAVQSLNGALLERDGVFIYAAIMDPQAASQELSEQGFEVEEAA